MPPRIPPGRAGRLWLRRRLGVAGRGRDHLDRKLRILTEDAQRARDRMEGARIAWTEAYDRARTWELRAALVEGPDALRSAADREPSTVRLGWASTVGVAYPVAADVVPGAPGPGFLADGAAVRPAIDAAFTALQAGARLAAEERAVQSIEAEVTATRRRLRALDERWLPWLTRSLADLDLALEQAEQEEAVRLRRALAGP